MRIRILVTILISLSLLAACDAGGTGSQPSGSTSSVPPPAGYEAFVENGNVARPNNAVDVFIVYSPESQAYMPDIIRMFRTHFKIRFRHQRMMATRQNAR